MSEFARRTLLRAVMARARAVKQHPKVQQPAAAIPGTDPRVAAEIEAARARLGLAR